MHVVHNHQAQQERSSPTSLLLGQTERIWEFYHL